MSLFMSRISRKKRLFFLAVLAGVMCLSACGGQKAQESEKVVLCGFESAKEMLTMNLYTMRAKVEIIDDKTYVTDGEKAAKFVIEGNAEVDQDGNVLYYKDNAIYLFPGNTYMKKTDFSDVKKYTIDIFNANERPMEIAFGYNHPDAASDSFLFGKRTLEPGKMNHLEFEVNNDVVSSFVDVTAVKSFYFILEGGLAGETPLEFYFDNFCAEIGEGNYQAAEMSGKIDFSNAADVHRFLELGGATSMLRRPQFSLNTDLNYVSTGRSSMKIEFTENKLGTGIDCVGFRSRDNMLEGFQTTDYENTYLEYELYNDTDQVITVLMSVYDPLNASYSVSTSIGPHSWSGKEGTSVSLATLKEYFLGNGLDIWTVAFTVSGLKEDGDSLYLDHLSVVGR